LCDFTPKSSELVIATTLVIECGIRTLVRFLDDPLLLEASNDRV
jgi:hypothetical protein